MGVKCEKQGGVGHLYYTAIGADILSRGWPSCPPRLFSQSVNGHLCVNNSTLILLYPEWLFEVQHSKRWFLSVLQAAAMQQNQNQVNDT